MQSKLRRRIATSPIARGAAFPLRTMIVARYDAHLIGRSVDWLVRSRETTNFTYDLNSLNRDQLCWFVSAVTGAGIGQVRAWMQELEDDSHLTEYLTRRLSSNPRRRICATEPHWARRSGGMRLSVPRSRITSSRRALTLVLGPVSLPLPCSETDTAASPRSTSIQKPDISSGNPGRVSSTAASVIPLTCLGR